MGSPIEIKISKFVEGEENESVSYCVYAEGEPILPLTTLTLPEGKEFEDQNEMNKCVVSHATQFLSALLESISHDVVFKPDLIMGVN